MNSKKPNSKNSKPAVSTEPQWVVADDSEASAEPRVEREHTDDSEVDFVQQAPDEVVWAPVEPAAASEAEGAPRVAKKAPRAADAKPARVAGKPQNKATNDVATEAANVHDAPAPSAPERKPKRASKRSATQPDAAEGASTQGDAGERKGTLAEVRTIEVATVATEPSAPALVTKKCKLERFVAGRAEQLARERVDERALERAADFAADRAADVAGDRAADRDLDRAQDRASEHAEEWGRERAEEFARERAEDFAADRLLECAGDAARPAPAPVAKKRRGKGASEPVTTSIVVEPQQLNPSEVEAVAPTDAPTEPASSMPSMEQYIAELGTMSVPQLVKRHVEMLGKAPRIKNRTWLQRKLAWHEQTRRFGGLSNAAKRRLDELMGQVELPAPTSRKSKTEAPAPRSTDTMPLGTRLERTYRGRVVCAVKVENGWDVDGVTHRSLSAAAKAITGSHCSGNAFFKLWQPKGGAR